MSNTTSLLVLIERHVSAYSEAIIRFTVNLMMTSDYLTLY